MDFIVLSFTIPIERINVREYWRGNKKWTIQRNWQHRRKKNKTKTQQHYTQANTTNVNKTWTLIQTTGGKDESNIVFYAEIVERKDFACF